MDRNVGGSKYTHVHTRTAVPATFLHALTLCPRRAQLRDECALTHKYYRTGSFFVLVSLSTPRRFALHPDLPALSFPTLREGCRALQPSPREAQTVGPPGQSHLPGLPETELTELTEYAV